MHFDRSLTRCPCEEKDNNNNKKQNKKSLYGFKFGTFIARLPNGGSGRELGSGGEGGGVRR